MTYGGKNGDEGAKFGVGTIMRSKLVPFLDYVNEHTIGIKLKIDNKNVNGSKTREERR